MRTLNAILAMSAMLLVTTVVYVGADVAADMAADSSPVTASSITLGVGPDMKELPAGTYQFVTVYADGTAPTSVIQKVGGGDSPPTPPPTPPSDLREAVKAALAANTDANKAKTAEGLVAAYSQLIASANQGDITDTASFAGAVKVFTMTMTLTNSEAWEPFAAIVDDHIGSCPALPSCVASLGVIVDELEAIQ